MTQSQYSHELKIKGIGFLPLNSDLNKQTNLSILKIIMLMCQHFKYLAEGNVVLASENQTHFLISGPKN